MLNIAEFVDRLVYFRELFNPPIQQLMSMLVN